MSQSTSLHALIIGINDYRDPAVENLSFAASDASSVQGFLEEILCVPKNNISVLLNHEATRSAILEKIRRHFIENASIQYGDPMLFYFAGHGTRYPAPHDWPTDDNECEAICPADRLQLDPEGELDELERDRFEGADILDRTLGALFAELAQEKGGNLTVIMDCCHSGSITRNAHWPEPPLPGMRFRLTSPITRKQTAMFIEAKEQLDRVRNSQHRQSKSVHGLNEPDSTSHVLLAACRQDQRAAEWDMQQSGVFTYSLMQVLRRADLSCLTYTALRNSMNFPSVLNGLQTPQCEGHQRYSVIFNGKALGVNTKLVPCARRDEQTLRIEAGSIHGVVEGTVFDVWSSQFHTSGTCMGRAVARTVYSVWAIAEPADLPIDAVKGDAFALVSAWKSSPFCVRFSPDAASQGMVEELQAHIRAVAEGRDETDVDIKYSANADTTVSCMTSCIILERGDELSRMAGCAETISFDGTPTMDAWGFLTMAARFDLHLRRENVSCPFRADLNVELCRLENHSPVGPNLVSALGRAELRNHDDASYGMLVHNRTNVDLWCSLFYFDPSDYSVVSMYTPPAEEMLPPLRRGSTLTLGYGSSAVYPFRFSLRDGEHRDVGWMKFFFSEKYADLRMIEQETGFAYSEPRRRNARRGRDGSAMDGTWDTLDVVIDVRA